MTITIFKNTAETNRMDKQSHLIKISDYDITLKNECSVTNPIIPIETTETLTNFLGNYAYIPDFNRYYFITNIVKVSENLWRISLTVDVLMSYKTQISNAKLNCFVSRNQFNYSEELKDERAPIQFVPRIDYTLIDDTIFNSTTSEKLYWVYIVCVSDEMETTQEIAPPDGTNYGVLNVPATTMYASQYTTKVYRLPVKSIQLKNFATNVLGSTSKVNFVISMCLLPISDDFGTFIYSEKMRVGNYTVDGVNGCQVLDLSANHKNIPIEYVTNYFQHLRKRFDLFEPYSRYEIYLPFYGWYKLPINDLFGQYLSISYIFDYIDGSCNITLSIRTSPEKSSTIAIIDSFDVKIAIDIPINYTNKADKERNTSINALNFTKNMLSGLGTAVAGAVIGTAPLGVGMIAGASLMITGISQMISAPVSFASNELANTESGGALKSQSSFSKIFGCMKIYIKHSAHLLNLDISDTFTFAELYGRPLNRIMPFNSLKGYTEILNIQLNKIDALLEEKAELAEIFKNGVIL